MFLSVVFTLVGGWYAFIIGGEYAAASPVFFSAAIFLSATTVVPYAAFILWLDRHEHEPFYLVLMTFVWGALVATSGAVVLNELFFGLVLGVTGNFELADSLTTIIAAPIVEECLKGMAVAGVFFMFRNEFTDLLDGIVYGALAGLGFAFFENVTYYASAAEGMGWGGMFKLAWARGLLGGIGSHAAYTAITGLGFALVRENRRLRYRHCFVPLFLVFGILVHVLWNYLAEGFLSHGSAVWVYLFDLPLAVLVLQGPFLFLIAVLVFFVLRRQKEVISEKLEEEPPAIVTMEERQALLAGRGSGRLVAFRFASATSWWGSRKLENALVDLAFAKWHESRDKGGSFGHDEVERLRESVCEIRRTLWAANED